jgi:hypothetical protein
MKYRGRKPTFTPQQFALVRELLNQGVAISTISKTTGLKVNPSTASKPNPSTNRLPFGHGIRPNLPNKISAELEIMFDSLRALLKDFLPDRRPVGGQRRHHLRAPTAATAGRIQ